MEERNNLGETKEEKKKKELQRGHEPSGLTEGWGRGGGGTCGKKKSNGGGGKMCFVNSTCAEQA